MWIFWSIHLSSLLTESWLYIFLWPCSMCKGMVVSKISLLRLSSLKTSWKHDTNMCLAHRSMPFVNEYIPNVVVSNHTYSFGKWFRGRLLFWHGLSLKPGLCLCYSTDGECCSSSTCTLVIFKFLKMHL